MNRVHRESRRVCQRLATYQPRPNIFVTVTSSLPLAFFTIIGSSPAKPILANKEIYIFSVDAPLQLKTTRYFSFKLSSRNSSSPIIALILQKAYNTCIYIYIYFLFRRILRHIESGRMPLSVYEICQCQEEDSSFSILGHSSFAKPSVAVKTRRCRVIKAPIKIYRGEEESSRRLFEVVDGQCDYGVNELHLYDQYSTRYARFICMHQTGGSPVSSSSLFPGEKSKRKSSRRNEIFQLCSTSFFLFLLASRRDRNRDGSISGKRFLFTPPHQVAELINILTGPIERENLSLARAGN